VLLSRSAAAIVVAFAAALTSAQTPPGALLPTSDRAPGAEGIEPHDTPPPECRITLPRDGSFAPPFPVPMLAGPDRFYFGTEKLWTLLPSDGTWRGSPSRTPGDFVYGDKLPWFRVHPAFSGGGPLTIVGKRLDGSGPSFTETWGRFGLAGEMIVGGIHIPVFGCWQVTGHYQDQELSFTVWVAPRPEHRPSANEISPAIWQRSSTQAAVPRRIRVDGKTQSSSLFYSVTPEIPPKARAANVSGTVVLHAVINTDGRPHELQYVSGPPQLAQAAIDAVAWWRYSGPVVGDEEVEVDTTIDVVFSPIVD
jgi:TonB family protein